MAPFPTQGSIYWFDPNPTRGSEITKKRPCVVVSPDELNRFLETVIIVPLTSNIRPWPFRAIVTIRSHQSSAACDQIRAIDKSRLGKLIANLNPGEIHQLLAVLVETFQPST